MVAPARAPVGAFSASLRLPPRMATLLTSNSAAHPTPSWAFVAGAWTLFGLMHGVVWAGSLREPVAAVRWTIPTALVVAWGWAMITPMVFRLATRARPSRVGWARSVAAHLLAMVVCAVAMTWCRQTAMAAFSSWTPEPFLPVFFYWFDVWLFVYATLVVVGHALAVRRRYVDRTVRAHLLEAQLARAQLQYLELQLQPHFLFNALNAIQELAHEAPKSAERMLRRLKALLSISLERSGHDEVTLDEELAALEPYLDIQRTRFSDWLDVRLSVHQSLRRALVPHLILQPLVENAIRHGLSVRPAPGRVVVRAERIGDRLILRVEDDGVGLPKTQRKGGGREGIGLRNASERLRQLYGASHRFELRDVPTGGVAVELEIPYREGELMERFHHSTDVGGIAIDPLSIGDITNWRTGEYSTTMAVPEGPESTPTHAVDSPPEWQVSGSFRAVRRPAEPNEPIAPADSLSPAPALTLRAWLVIVGLWFALAVFWTNQMVLFSHARMPSADGKPWLEFARLQFATSVIWLALSPVVLALARRFRMDANNWKRVLPLHVVFGMTTGVLHTGLMRLTGLSEVPLLSPGNMNPLTGDFFVYFGLLAWSHARDFVAWYRTRELEGARLSARIAGSRFQSLRVQLRPLFLLSTLELLADLVHTDVPRTERLIARLADTLRLTLDSGRSPTTSIKQELELLHVSIETHRIGVRPGVQMVVHVSPEALLLRIPSRLLCTMVDELFASDALHASAPLTVRVEVERAADTTRIRLRAETAWPTGRLEPHSWWRTKSVAEAAVADAGALVSVTFPDRATAVLIIADDPEIVGHHAPAELVGAVA